MYYSPSCPKITKSINSLFFCPNSLYPTPTHPTLHICWNTSISKNTHLRLYTRQLRIRTNGKSISTSFLNLLKNIYHSGLSPHAEPHPFLPLLNYQNSQINSIINQGRFNSRLASPPFSSDPKVHSENLSWMHLKFKSAFTKYSTLHPHYSGLAVYIGNWK